MSDNPHSQAQAWISQKEAVRRIAPYLMHQKPTPESLNHANDRVRKKIAYAVKTKELPAPALGRKFPRELFLQWAKDAFPNEVGERAFAPPRQYSLKASGVDSRPPSLEELLQKVPLNVGQIKELFSRVLAERDALSAQLKRIETERKRRNRR